MGLPCTGILPAISHLFPPANLHWLQDTRTAKTNSGGRRLVRLLIASDLGSTFVLHALWLTLDSPFCRNTLQIRPLFQIKSWLWQMTTATVFLAQLFESRAEEDEDTETSSMSTVRHEAIRRTDMWMHENNVYKLPEIFITCDFMNSRRY